MSQLERFQKFCGSGVSQTLRDCCKNSCKFEVLRSFFFHRCLKFSDNPQLMITAGPGYAQPGGFTAPQMPQQMGAMPGAMPGAAPGMVPPGTNFNFGM